MKKHISLLISFILVCVLLLALTSCDILEMLLPADQHECSFTGGYACDDMDHWIPCDDESCDAISNKGTHILDSNLVCTDCGYQHVCTLGEWESNGDFHYKYCENTICSQMHDEEHSFEAGVCTVCAYRHECETYGDWQRDATHHWIGCENETCEEKLEYGAHEFENGFCYTCSYTHTCKNSGRMEYDPTFHWYACTEPTCDEQFECDWHQMDGISCTVCDYGRHVCDFNVEWTYDDTHHYKVCADPNCGSIDYPSAAKHCYENGVCICGKVGVNPHVCSFKAEWTKDETCHWHECEDEFCDEISGSAAHDFSDGDCVCGKAAPSVCGKLSEEEWRAVFDNSKLSKVKVTYHFANGADAADAAANYYTETVSYDNGIIRISVSKHASLSHYYLNGVWYTYDKDTEECAQINMDLYGSYIGMADELSRVFDLLRDCYADLIYDEEKDSYTVFLSDSVMSMVIKDGYLSSITYTDITTPVPQGYTANLSLWGEAEIALPFQP